MPRKKGVKKAPKKHIQKQKQTVIVNVNKTTRASKGSKQPQRQRQPQQIPQVIFQQPQQTQRDERHTDIERENKYQKHIDDILSVVERTANVNVRQIPTQSVATTNIDVGNILTGSAAVLKSGLDIYRQYSSGQREQNQEQQREEKRVDVPALARQPPPIPARPQRRIGIQPVSDGSASARAAARIVERPLNPPPPRSRFPTNTTDTSKMKLTPPNRVEHIKDILGDIETKGLISSSKYVMRQATESQKEREDAGSKERQNSKVTLILNSPLKKIQEEKESDVMSFSQLMKDQADIDRIGRQLKTERRQRLRDESLRRRARPNKGSAVARENIKAIGTKRRSPT